MLLESKTSHCSPILPSYVPRSKQMFAQPSDRCTFSCARISFFASSEKLLNQRKPPRRLFSERQRTNNGQHHTGNFQQHPHQQPTKREREREREREIKASLSLLHSSSSLFFFPYLSPCMYGYSLSMTSLSLCSPAVISPV